MLPFRIQILLLWLVALCWLSGSAEAVNPRKMENLGRGVVAVRKNEEVFLSWRLLGLDPAGIQFNVYRSAGGATPTKLNSSPLTGGCNYTDSKADLNKANAYFVRPVLNGAEQAPSGSWTLPAKAESGPFFRIPLQPPPQRKVFNIWVGDLDGDGEYEFVINWIGATSGQTQKLQAYRREGKLLWEVDLGPNSVDSDNIYVTSATIAAGQWDGATVYDLDSDGRAEVIVKTANGVTFGDGTVLKEHDNLAQFISVLDGMSGAEKARATLPNPWKIRIKRPLGAQFGIGYPDGTQPSLIVHAKNRNDSKSFNLIESAWDFRNGKLSQRWSIDYDGDRGGSPVEGHQIRIMDLDGDGRDELIGGMHAVSSEGKLLWNLGTQGLNHGDRFHIGDLDPKRPGLEMYGIQQNNPSGIAEYYGDAKTGKILWTVNVGKVVDAARGSAIDIDPRHPGYEMWSFYGIHNTKGDKISDEPKRPYPNLVLWWDGDLLGENLNEGKIEKWNYQTQSTSRLFTAERLGAQANPRHVPPLLADILGDWREEIVLAKYDMSELMVFTTDIPTQTRLYTLPHNPAYRNCMTTKGYVQQNMTDFFLGDGMSPPPVPNITYVTPATKAIAAAAGTAAAPLPTPAPVRRVVDRFQIDFRDKPGALLVIKGLDGKMQLVRADAVTVAGNAVAAEMRGGGRGVWQREAVLGQLPIPTQAELASGAVEAELLPRYDAVALRFPTLKAELDRDITTMKEAVAAVKERRARVEARYVALAANKYDADRVYTIEDLEGIMQAAELAAADQPEKNAEIEGMVSPFREHLEKLVSGQQRVGGVWRTAEEVEALRAETARQEALLRSLREPGLPALILTRAQLLQALQGVLVAMVLALAAGGLLAAMPRTRIAGILLLVLTGGGVAYLLYGVAQREGGSVPAAETDAAEAAKVVRSLTAAPSASGEGGAPKVRLTETELNAFAREYLQPRKPAENSGDLQRLAYAVSLAEGKLTLFEQVRLGAKERTISYTLRPAAEGEPFRLESISLGRVPAPPRLRQALREQLAGEVARLLGPALPGWRPGRIDKGEMELIPGAAASAPAPGAP